MSPGEQERGVYFDYELRKKFDKYDTSRDGKIGFDEFVLFLKGELHALTVGVTLEEQQKLMEVFDTLARDCLLMLLDAAG